MLNFNKKRYNRIRIKFVVVLVRINDLKNNLPQSNYSYIVMKHESCQNFFKSVNK